MFGAPDTIRTCDPLVRSQVLYPAELRVRISFTFLFIAFTETLVREEGGIIAK